VLEQFGETHQQVESREKCHRTLLHIRHIAQLPPRECLQECLVSI
jgi:hypothetical protein